MRDGPTLTPVAGMLAVTELTDRLDVAGWLDAAIKPIKPIKQRRRGHTAGQVLVGIAAAQLAGEDFWGGRRRPRLGWRGDGHARRACNAELEQGIRGRQMGSRAAPAACGSWRSRVARTR